MTIELLKRYFKMKLYQQIQTENLSNMVLYGSILLASIDYIGILDYLIKAVLGGGVWFGFKLMQDHFSIKVKKRAEKKHEDKEQENKQDEKK